jgi:4-carboxymuconolactone decarboxylase
MMSKDVFERGLAIRKEVLGTEFVENSLKTADDFNMPMQELTTEYC